MAAPAALPPVLRILGHPLRWRLAVELACSDLRVGELTRLVSEPQNLVSYHLRVLRSSGLVTATRSSHDGRDRYHHLDLDACADALAGAGAALHPALQTTAAPAPARASAKPRVLFVCTGNSARSPIAEALLRRRGGDHVRVSSAGTRPKPSLHPHAVRVLREEYGIDVAAQQPRQLDPEWERYDRVVTLCDKAREVVGVAGRPSGARTHWSIPDPAADGGAGRQGYGGFVSIARDIEARVGHLMPILGIAS